MAHTILHLFPNIRKYYYVDIPPILYVSTQYLKHFFGDAVKDYRTTRLETEIKFDDSDSLEIVPLCPWQIENLKGEFDFFWNSSSLREMTTEIVINYAKHLDRIVSKKGNLCFFVYDGGRKETTLTKEQVEELLRENTDFSFKNFRGPVSNHVVPGVCFFGKVLKSD